MVGNSRSPLARAQPSISCFEMNEAARAGRHAASTWWRGTVIEARRFQRVVACSVLLGTWSPPVWAQPAPTTEAPPSSAVPDAAAAAALVPPKLRKDVQPTYPAAALEQGLAASVLLELDISVAGFVQRAS